jgi:hypothetical protein
MYRTNLDRYPPYDARAGAMLKNRCESAVIAAAPPDHDSNARKLPTMLS